MNGVSPSLSLCVGCDIPPRSNASRSLRKCAFIQRTAPATLLTLAYALVPGTPARAAESATKPSLAAEKCMEEASARKLVGNELQTFIMHCVNGNGNGNGPVPRP